MFSEGGCHPRLRVAAAYSRRRERAAQTRPAALVLLTRPTLPNPKQNQCTKRRFQRFRVVRSVQLSQALATIGPQARRRGITTPYFQATTEGLKKSSPPLSRSVVRFPHSTTSTHSTLPEFSPFVKSSLGNGGFEPVARPEIYNEPLPCVHFQLALTGFRGFEVSKSARQYLPGAAFTRPSCPPVRRKLLRPQGGVVRGSRRRQRVAIANCTRGVDRRQA